MLEHSPRLMALTLKCKDLDFVWTVYSIRELVTKFPPVPVSGSGVPTVQCRVRSPRPLVRVRETTPILGMTNFEMDRAE